MKVSRRILAPVAAAAFAGWIAFRTWSGFVFSDEALRSVRTALNLATGRAFGFNAADRVLTFDHPLWLALEAILAAITSHYAICLMVASAAAAGGGAYLALRRAAGPKGWLLALVLPAVPSFGIGVSAGLAVPLAILLLAGLADGLAAERDGVSPASAAPTMRLGALAFLAQFSAAALVLPVAAWRMLSGAEAPRWRRNLAAAWPAAAWLGLSLACYGGLLPHSLAGDPAHHPVLAERLRAGLVRGGEFLLRDPFACALLAGALAKTVASLGRGVRRDYSDWLGWGLCAGLAVEFLRGSGGWSQGPAAVLVWMAFLVLAHDRRIPTPLFLLFGASVFLFFGGTLEPSRSRSRPGVAWPSRRDWARQEPPRTEPRSIDLADEPGGAGLREGPSAYVLGRFALSDPFWSARNRAVTVRVAGTEGPASSPARVPSDLGRGDPVDAVAVDLRLKDLPAGSSEPILSAGRPGDGDVYQVEHLGRRTIRLAVYKAKWGVTLISRAIPNVDFSRIHHAVIKYGVGPEGVEWAGRGLIAWDGVVEKQTGVPYRARRVAGREVAIGWNTLGAPGCASAFAGDILQAEAADGSGAIGLPAPRLDLPGRVLALRVKLLAGARAPLPLLVTGREGAGDALFVRQVGPALAQFGYGHWGDHALVWAPPTPLDFARPHEIDLLCLRRGFGGWLRENLAEVRLDGSVAFVTFQDFHPFGPDEVYILENPIQITSCETDFEGEVLDRGFRPARPEELPRPEDTRAADLRDGTGPLAFTLIFSGAPPGAGQALVETGRPGRGDIVYLVQDDATHYHFGFDHWGVGGAVGAPFAIDTALPHRVTVEMSSLLPAVARTGPAARAVRLTLDGRLVLSTEFACYEAGPGEIYIAANRLGASTTAMPFQGTILDARRL